VRLPCFASFCRHRHATEEAVRRPLHACQVIHFGFGFLRQPLCVSDKFPDAEVADMKSKVFGGYFFQLVRLVKDDGGIVRKESSNIRLPNRQIRKEQVVIHNHNVRFHCFLAHQCKEAAVVVLAFCSKATFAAGVKPRPEIAVNVPSQLRLVSSLCDRCPGGDLLEDAQFLHRKETFRMCSFEFCPA
jgi:hypothetical protein